MNDYNYIVDYLAKNRAIPEELRSELIAWIAEHADDPELEKYMLKVWERAVSNNQQNENVEGLANLLDEINPGWSKSEMLGMIADNEHVRKSFASRFRKSLRYVAVAASVIVLGVISYFIYENNFNDTVTFITEQGKTGEFILPDGSTVLLNADSKLTYSKKGFRRGDTRDVKLEGEGFFDVVHDKSKPFHVDMSGIMVEVLGTSFDVKNYAHSPLKEVVLLSGKVKIKEDEGARKTLILAPDQRYVYQTATGKSEVEDTRAKNYCSWHQESYKIENESIRNVLIALSRKYCLDLEIDPVVDVDRNITFTIYNEPIGDVMTTISYLTELNYEIDNNTLYISSQQN